MKVGLAVELAALAVAVVVALATGSFPDWRPSPGELAVGALVFVALLAYTRR
jgi:hypothetical protein